MLAKVSFAGFKVNLPASRLLRVCLGGLLVVGGVFGFLPVLGFWMVPLGLIVLSVDSPVVRRFRRSGVVKLGHWLQKRWPGLARKLGFGAPRAKKH